MRITSRDKEVLKLLQEHTDTAFSTLALAKLHYPSDSEKSSITIANRRLKKLHEAGVIKCIPRRFGTFNYYYISEEVPAKRVVDVDDEGNCIIKE